MMNLQTTLERFLEIYPNTQYLQLIYGKQIVKIDLKLEYSCNLVNLFINEIFNFYDYNDNGILILKYYV